MNHHQRSSSRHVTVSNTSGVNLQLEKRVTLFTSTPSLGLLAIQSNMRTIHGELDPVGMNHQPTRVLFDNDDKEVHDHWFQHSDMNIKSNASQDMNLVFLPQPPQDDDDAPSKVVTPPGSPDSAMIHSLQKSSYSSSRSSTQRKKVNDSHSKTRTSPVGHAEMTFPDGRIFRGRQHSNGQPITGVMTYPDGTIYEGGWVDGQRSGNACCCWFPDGSRYKGGFRDGNFHGYGLVVWGDDGGFYRGEWYQGEMNGMGVEVREDGSIRHDGMWRDGVPVRRSRSSSTRDDASIIIILS